MSSAGFPRRDLDLSIDRAKRPAEWWAHPMNGQARRAAIAVEVVARCSVAQIIETGTYLGTTTAFLATSGLPVVTVERDKQLAEDAEARLRPWPNVRVINDDSPRAIRALLSSGVDVDLPTFFYLDAHAGRHLPLHEELSLMVAYFPRSVAMIDDFKVPDDPGYGCGPKASLDLLQGSLAKLAAFFPAAKSQEETGARRGSVVVSASTELVPILGRLSSLRRWR